MATLHEKREAIMAKAQEYQKRIKAGEALSESEIATVRGLLAEVDQVDLQIKEAEEASQTLARIGYLPPGTEVPSGNASLDARSGIKAVPVLIGKHVKTASLGASILAKMVEGGVGVKSLEASGSTLVPIPLVSTNPLALPETPVSFLDVLRVEVRPGPVFEYLRQVSRNINAAFVPAGQEKPTSTLAIERVRGELQVLATISEPMDKYLIGDNASLANFVQGQLAEGIRHALEREVLTGDGTSYTSGSATYHHLTGLLNTSGTQVLHATAKDKAVTLRSTIDLLEDEGHSASVFVLNPIDWREIETQRNASGTFDLGGIAARSARTLWSVPVVTTRELTPGTAVALDTSAVTLDTDGSLAVEWDASGSLFDRNQTRTRIEGRFGLSVYRPAGVVKVNLQVAAG